MINRNDMRCDSFRDDEYTVVDTCGVQALDAVLKTHSCVESRILCVRPAIVALLLPTALEVFHLR